MAYNPIGKKFKIDGESFCFGVNQDDDFGVWTLALFHNVAGQWLAIPPFIHDGMTNENILAYGSVSAYINAMLPKAEEALKRYFATPSKPDQTNKAACVAYDLALDIDYKPETGTFIFNKQPPLSHAR